TSHGVVLPAPFGPRSAKTSPDSIWRSTPRTASSEPYDLRSPVTSIATVIGREAYRRARAARRVVHTGDMRVRPPLLGCARFGDEEETGRGGRPGGARRRGGARARSNRRGQDRRAHQAQGPCAARGVGR